MRNALKKREKSQETLAMVFGICAMIILSIICYIIGYLISQGDNFAPGTNYGLVIKAHSIRFFISILSCIVPIIVYIIQFKQKANRSETDWSFIKIKGSGVAPFVYKGWALWAVITGVVNWVAACLIHYFAFAQKLYLLKPIMVLVFSLQTIVCIAVFFIPAFKPLKRA